MQNLIQNLNDVRERISEAEKKYHRETGSVTLLIATKTQSAESLKILLEAGENIFGESYLQEGLEKIEVLKEENIEWHFIGPIQSNKTKQIAEHFSWVHSVDREKIARRLNDQRPENSPPLNVCIEVNISGEKSKSGCEISELSLLVKRVQAFPKLTLRGLMAIPAPCDDFSKQRLVFRKLKAVFDELNQQGVQLDTLSMGMTQDFEAAIAEGATIVRIGTAIFGARL